MMGIVSSGAMTAAQQPSHDQTILTVDLVDGKNEVSAIFKHFGLDRLA
jgi:hypothetical protein